MADWGIETFEFDSVKGMALAPADFELSAKGSFDLTPLVRPPRFDPDTTTCEACGTPVFLLRIVDERIADQQGWFEYPRSAGPFTQSTTAHTKKRCQAIREERSGG